MKIPVLVEPLKGNGYRARGTEPFALTARGSTREEALAKLRAKIQNPLKNGTELVALEIGSQADPWMEFAGMFKDDPWINDWKQSIQEYRQKVEDDADAPGVCTCLTLTCCNCSRMAIKPWLTTMRSVAAATAFRSAAFIQIAASCCSAEGRSRTV